MSPRGISVSEVSEHDQEHDAWIVINGDVWDVTDFAPKHPGGLDVIRAYLGRDGSAAYNEVHGPRVAATHLESSCLKGRLDLSTMTDDWKARESKDAKTAQAPRKGDWPPLDAIINLHDFEDAAHKRLSAKSWAYYTCGANDSFTKEANAHWYRKIMLRPRLLVGVREVDCSTTILGRKYSMPVFSAPAALAKLSHPDGELAIARATALKGTTMVACHNASYSFPEIRQAMPAGNPIFYQLYFNKDRAATDKVVREVASLKPQAIIVTADLPVVGKRDGDERLKIDTSQTVGNLSPNGAAAVADKKGAGLARSTGALIDPDLKWCDIEQLVRRVDIPVFVKGIQHAADARRALAAGCAGIYISNHGGRAADTAQPSILTLLEIQANCPEVLEQMEVFIDGGVRRGTDVLKAVCLGASAVCIGRAILYATTYGQEGVEHALDSESTHFLKAVCSRN